MALGFESKSVEAQQEEARGKKTAGPDMYPEDFAVLSNAGACSSLTRTPALARPQPSHRAGPQTRARAGDCGFSSSKRSPRTRYPI